MINTGKNASTKSLLNSAFQGALFGAVVAPFTDIGLTGLKSGYAALTGADSLTFMGLPEYFTKYGMTNDVMDIGQTFSGLAQKGMDVNEFDFNKVFFGVNKEGDVALRYYNDVHMGYGTNNQIFNYVKDIFGRTGGEPLNFGTAGKLDLTTQQTVRSLQEMTGGAGLGGVRAAANPEFEGMYFNVPTYNNNPIFLNYLGIKGSSVGSESITQFSFNPFSPQGTFGTLEVNELEDISQRTIADFRAETGYKGSLKTTAGRKALSTYLGESATREQATIFSPYQNLPGIPGDEIQMMGTPGTILSGSGNKVLIMDYDEGILPRFLPKVTFARLGTNAKIGFDSSYALSEITTYGEKTPISTAPINTIDTSPYTSEAIFYSGSSIVDPIVSTTSANYGGFSAIQPSKSNIDFTSSGLIKLPSSFSAISSSFSSGSFLSGSVVSYPSSISSGSSKNSLFKSISSAGGSFLSDISSFDSSMSSIESASSSNNSSSKSASESMKYSSDYWFRHGFPAFMILGGGKSKGLINSELGITSSKYMPSLGAAFFGITGSKKTLKKQNAKGGALNSVFRPIIS